jgi:hypothetical protein
LKEGKGSYSYKIKGLREVKIKVPRNYKNAASKWRNVMRFKENKDKVFN